MRRRIRITFSPEQLYTKSEVEGIISYLVNFRSWIDIFNEENFFPGILAVEPSIKKARETGLADFSYGRNAISDLEKHLRKYNIEHKSG